MQDGSFLPKDRLHKTSHTLCYRGARYVSHSDRIAIVIAGANSAIDVPIPGGISSLSSSHFEKKLNILNLLNLTRRIWTHPQVQDTDR